MEKETMKLEDIHLLTESVHTELCSHRAYMELHGLRLKADGLYMQYLERLNKLKDLLERLGRTQEVFLSPVAVDGTILRLEERRNGEKTDYFLREYRVVSIKFLRESDKLVFKCDALSTDEPFRTVILHSFEFGERVFLTAGVAMDRLQRLRASQAEQCVIGCERGCF